MGRQQHHELGAAARPIIDSNFYMTLGTADEEGRPWVSPVYYAAEGYAKFYWVSSPEATHSRNLAVRPEVGIAIFARRSRSHGAGEWGLEDVGPFARHRLYRATASEHYVLDPQARRTPVSV